MLGSLRWLLLRPYEHELELAGLVLAVKLVDEDYPARPVLPRGAHHWAHENGEHVRRSNQLPGRSPEWTEAPDPRLRPLNIAVDEDRNAVESRPHIAITSVSGLTV